MNITKRVYNYTAKATMRYQSASVSEGVEVAVDDSFDEFEYERLKQQVQQRVDDATKDAVVHLMDDVENLEKVS